MVPYYPTRTLHSQRAGLPVVPRVYESKMEGRAFSYQALLLWNYLLAVAQEADILCMFKGPICKRSLFLSLIPKSLNNDILGWYNLKGQYLKRKKKKREILQIGPLGVGFNHSFDIKLVRACTGP